MTGRQQSFFLAPSEQAAFELKLREAGDMSVLMARSSTPLPITIASTVIAQFGKERLRVLLARTEDVDEVVFVPVAGRREYSCDPTSSPVVEFDRCYAADDFIRSGRLYFIPRYYGPDGNLISKNQNFLDWASAMMRAARRYLHEVDHDVFAGPEAVALRASGFRFEGVD